MFDFATTSLAQAIGWSLIHFLWQGTLIAILAWLAISFCSVKRSNLRYMIASIGMCLMLLCPIVTTYCILDPLDNSSLTASSSHFAEDTTTLQGPDLSNSQDSNSPLSGSNPPMSPGDYPLGESLTFVPDVDVETSPWWTEISIKFSESVEAILPLLIGAWFMGVIFLSTRLVFGWWGVQRLRGTGELVTHPKVLGVLNSLQAKIEVNFSIPIRESMAVHSPLAIGWLKPVILLPVSAITNLTTDQLSAILAHELAHIRRADYLVNLFQSAIEILLFYHPAVWWLSAQVRKERENCCDDLAIRICNNKRQYVEALLKLEKSRSSTNKLVMAADAGSLVDRIARMLGRDPGRSTRGGWLAAVIAAILVCILVGFAVSPPSNADVSGILKLDQDDDTARLDEKKIIRVKALAPDKTPVIGANIKLGVWYQETATSEDFITDENGIAEIKLPDGVNTFRLWAYGEGYTRLFANWESEEFGRDWPLPDEFVFEMVPAVKIGGTVVDEQGKPIPGVSVEVKRVTTNDRRGQRTKFGSWFAEGASAQVTDDRGEWTLENIPPGDEIELALRFSHSDYIGDEGWGGIQADHGIGLKQLRNETAKVTLREGIKIRGTITDEAGNPVTDAMIVWGDDPYLQQGRQETFVEDDGTYETPTQREGELRITVVAPDYEPQTRLIEVESEMDNVDFSMGPGKNVMIKFVDEVGDPVPNVYVGIRKWRNSQALFNHQHPNVFDTRIPRRSNANGVYSWDWAPEDNVTYAFYAAGYFESRERTLAASDNAHTIVMKKKAGITGTVTDEAGNPLKSFLVIPRFHANERIASAHRSQAVEGHHGEFRIVLDGREGEYSLIVEADGFETANTDKFQRDSRPKPFEIKLKRSTATAMRVVDESGLPVANATVLLAPADQVLSMQNYDDRFAIQRSKNTTSDNQGEFKFPNASVPRTIIAIADQGYGEVPDSTSNPAETITLRKWASVKGKGIQDGQPWDVGCWYRPIRLHHGKYFHIQTYISGQREGEGNFRVPKIAAMPAAVDIFAANDPLGRRYQLAIDPNPGQEYELDFSRASNVKATIQFAGVNKDKVDFAKSKFQFRKLEPSISIPSEILRDIAEFGLKPNDFDRVVQQYAKTELIHPQVCYSTCFDSYRGSLDENGELSVDILRPGKYEFTVQAMAKSDSKYDGAPMSEFTQIVEIAGEPLELGALTVTVLDDPIPNSKIANFEFNNLDDKSVSSINDFAGSYVLLDFWCPYCDFCELQTAKIQRLAGIMARVGKTRIVSLKSSGSGPVERVPSSFPTGLDWVNAQLPYGDEKRVRRNLGVWTTQHLILIDPEGNYVAGGSFAKIVKKLDELGLK